MEISTGKNTNSFMRHFSAEESYNGVQECTDSVRVTQPLASAQVKPNIKEVKNSGL